MHALEMFGGLAAGPLAATDAGVTTGSETAAGPGAFAALVAKALGGPGLDEGAATAESGDSDEIADTDLSMLLAMAGLLPTPLVMQPVPDSAATAESGSDAEAVEPAAAPSVEGAAGTAALDTLPCTLLPVVAEGASDATFDAIPAEAGTAPGTPIVTATRDAEMVADDAPVATAPSAVPSTVAAPAGPAAVEIHEIRMETAGPAVAPSGDSAQMIGELRAATPASVTPATIPGSQDAADVVPVQPLPRAAMTKAAVHPVAADPSGLEAQSALTASGVDATALQRAASQPAESSPVASVSADVVTTTAVRSGGPSPGRNVEQMPSPETEAGVTAAQGQAAISAYRASEQGSDGGDTRDRSEQQHESASAVSAVSKAVAGSVSEQVGVTATFTVPGATTDGALQAASGTGETVRSDAAPVTPRDTAHNVQTMVRSARLHFSEGGGEARLQLQPEHLGPVTLTVRVEQGRVSAHIQADTVDASRWIETHQQELRGALRDQGLDVKEVVVTTNPDGRREREAPHARPQAARRRQNADAPRFEVVV